MISRRKPKHPGEFLLEDVIKPLNMTITEAAKKLGVSRKALSELVNGKVSLTPEMAVRISESTKTSLESWMNMQTKLNLWKIMQNKPNNVYEFKRQIAI